MVAVVVVDIAQMAQMAAAVLDPSTLWLTFSLKNYVELLFVCSKVLLMFEVRLAAVGAAAAAAAVEVFEEPLW